MKIVVGHYNPNENKKNPIHEEIMNKHFHSGRTKTRKEKQAQVDRAQKQKGWE